MSENLSDSGTLPAAFRNSMEILQEVRRAEALLRSHFGAGSVDAHGLLARPDRCSDALTDAIRALLEAQKRLVGTEWPQFNNESVNNDSAAGQPAHLPETEAAA